MTDHSGAVYVVIGGGATRDRVLITTGTWPGRFNSMSHFAAIRMEMR